MLLIDKLKVNITKIDNKHIKKLLIIRIKHALQRLIRPLPQTLLNKPYNLPGQIPQLLYFRLDLNGKKHKLILLNQVIDGIQIAISYFENMFQLFWLEGFWFVFVECVHFLLEMLDHEGWVHFEQRVHEGFYLLLDGLFYQAGFVHVK